MKQQENKTIRTKRGVVVRMSGPTTAVVQVSTLKSHPKYHKRFSSDKRFHAQVAEGKVAVGQTVTMIESRPYSKLKRWRVVSVSGTPKATETLEESEA